MYKGKYIVGIFVRFNITVFRRDTEGPWLPPTILLPLHVINVSLYFFVKSLYLYILLLIHQHM